MVNDVNIEEKKNHENAYSYEKIHQIINIYVLEFYKEERTRFLFFLYRIFWIEFSG